MLARLLRSANLIALRSYHLLFTKEELELLVPGNILSPALVSKVRGAAFNGRHYQAELSEDEVLMIDEACNEELPISGFDAQYEPTKHGRLLEGLIDKFYDALESGAEDDNDHQTR